MLKKVNGEEKVVRKIAKNILRLRHQQKKAVDHQTSVVRSDPAVNLLSDQQRDEQRTKQQHYKIPWYEQPEFSWNQSEVSRGRGLLKKNSRPDPSPSIKRKPSQLKKNVIGTPVCW